MAHYSILTGEASTKASTISPSEKESTIQYGNRKCRTHALMFTQTLEHGNSKNEIRQTNRRRQEDKSECV